jgi:hypothetical protein
MHGGGRASSPAVARQSRRFLLVLPGAHPGDANGGDKAAEERLKDINDAYTTLRRFLTA